MSGLILVHGTERLAIRTLEQLEHLGIPAEALGALGVGELEGRLAAGGADALVLCDEDDIANFHLALAAREAAPGLRLVVRLFNLELGAQAEQLLGCRALSASQLAAPAFVEAGLRGDYAQRIHVEEHELRVLSGGGVPLLALDSPGGVLPGSLAGATSVIGLPRPRTTAKPRRLGRRRLATVTRFLLSDRRLRWLGAILLALIALTTALYASVEDLAVTGALHRSVAAVLGSDELTDDAPGWLQVYDSALLLVGVAVLALAIALVTDAMVSTRIAHVLGIPRRLRDHAIVCGLGTVGFRIASELQAEGIPVCGVDLDQGQRLTRARTAGIAATVGDASQAATLQALGVQDAAYLFCVTDNDVANLEAALVARAENPELRIVLRLFDPDLAGRIERVAGLGVSRSVSDLAAPAFAAAALGRDVTDAIRTRHGLLLVARAGSLHGSVGDVEGDGSLRVLSRERDGHVHWAPAAGEQLQQGDRVTVIGTQAGLARLSAG